MRYVLALLLVLATPAFAHHAPSGWKYDGGCCGERDCHPIPNEAVRRMGDMLVITVLPGMHPMIDKPTTFTFPIKQVKQSKDDEWHLCTVGMTDRARCVYEPRVGV